MTNNNNPYNQLPRKQMMPFANSLTIPKWMSGRSIAFYFVALAIVNFVYSAHALPWYYMLSGAVSVIAFFAYGQYESEKLSLAKVRKEKSFEKKIFIVALVPRLLWMILIYIIFMNAYGDEFGFENGDALFYSDIGEDFAANIADGTFGRYWNKITQSVEVSDLGYAVYVGLIYSIFGKSILLVRVLKCIISAYTVVLLYRLAKRHFDSQVARIAAIFCALWPNFWYYCGTHLKEPEMVFLVVLFVEQADQMLRSRKFTAWKVLPVLLIGLALFGFRTPLAIVAVLALLFAIVMASQRVVSWGKRIIVGALTVLLIAVTVGDQLETQTSQLFDKARSDEQEQSLKWRGERENGNAFAKYAGATVFAPMIFTIPFPTMTQPFDGQNVQQLNNGGNFIKNILSGFTIFALVMLLMTGKWREHTLPLALMLGYLVVLTMSAFAQAERFHQPVMPLEFMFMAYGMSIAVTRPKYKRWFTYWCALMFVASVAWNWFKLAGRGEV